MGRDFSHRAHQQGWQYVLLYGVAAMLLGDWSAPKPRGIWSDGNKASIVFDASALSSTFSVLIQPLQPVDHIANKEPQLGCSCGIRLQSLGFLRDGTLFFGRLFFRRKPSDVPVIVEKNSLQALGALCPCQPRHIRRLRMFVFGKKS